MIAALYSIMLLNIATDLRPKFFKITSVERLSVSEKVMRGYEPYATFKLRFIRKPAAKSERFGMAVNVLDELHEQNQIEAARKRPREDFEVEIQWEDLSLSILKTACQTLRVPFSGKKEVIIERLKQASEEKEIKISFKYYACGTGFRRIFDKHPFSPIAKCTSNVEGVFN